MISRHRARSVSLPRRAASIPASSSFSLSGACHGCACREPSRSGAGAGRAAATFRDRQHAAARDLAEWDAVHRPVLGGRPRRDLRAQVSGYLTEIHFTDGQIVHKGDLLFVIDPRPYRDRAAAGARRSCTAAVRRLDLANSRSIARHRTARSDFAPAERARPARAATQRVAAGRGRAGQGARCARPSSIWNSRHITRADHRAHRRAPRVASAT